MSRKMLFVSNLRVGPLWALSVLAAAVPATQAQDAAGVQDTASAQATGAAGPSSQSAGGASAEGPGHDRTAADGPLVCFKLTMRCFGGKAAGRTSDSPRAATPSSSSAGSPTPSGSAPSGSPSSRSPSAGSVSTGSSSTSAPSTSGPETRSASATDHSTDESGRPLNLGAPDIRTVVSAQELREPLPTEDQQAAEQDADTVEVKTAPETPDVPGGFGALWWALKHPTQAWRIFAPVE